MVRFAQEEKGVDMPITEHAQHAHADIAALQLVVLERFALAAERSSVASDRLAAADEACLVCTDPCWFRCGY